MNLLDKYRRLSGRFEVYDLSLKMKQNSGCIFDFFPLMNINCLIREGIGLGLGLEKQQRK